MSDPFRIEGPAIISFSGGRTSAYMLWRILQAHAGTLPDDIKVCFSNTGKEAPQTLDFVRDCGERWGVEIVWLEYVAAEKTKDRWRVVTYGTASRKGEPFSAVIDKRGYLPTPPARFCTQELKIGAMRRWAATVGLRGADNVIGLRADEPRRVARLRGRNDGYEVLMPLAVAGITKRDVMAFWMKQNFDLRLPNIGGKTPAGNCDLCFLKSTATIQGLIRRNPELADWWIAQEEKGRASKPGGAIFRSDRPSYRQMRDAVQNQRDFDFGDEEIIDCFCGDAA